MGTVYCAVDETLHRDVAIKVLNAELSDPTVARRFRAEAVTVARLNHPGIATIYELVQHNGQWLMVMEFVRGETLEHLVTRAGPLPVEQAAGLGMQMLAALAHAHGLGIVHRDLKPANLILASVGTLKVMDFGIARVAGAEQLTSAGFMMGTPAYMAPEQVLGQEIDARTDLYAAGLVLFHLLTGTLPFNGRTPIDLAQARIQDQPTPVRGVRADLPAWVGQVLDIALAREPNRRFQSALLFREALRRGLANLPIDTPPPAVLPPELIATAAPASMPVLSAPDSAAPPKRTQPPPAEMPTMPHARPVTVVDGAAQSQPSGGAPARRPGSLRIPMMAGVAVGVIATGVATFMWVRSYGPSASSPETVVAMGTAAMGPADSASAATAANTSKAETAVPRSGTSDAGPSNDTAPATPLQPPASVTGAVPAGPAAGPAPSATSLNPASARATPAAAGAAGRSGRGRAAAAAAEPTATFRGLRAFVVTDRRVDERPALLSFDTEQVTLSSDTGELHYGSLPYAQVTAAAHTRGRNPRWYPTLASPRSDVDMPGGLFRSERHWLTLQSRAGYLIVRLNDGDWQRIVETVTRRIGIKVDQLAPVGQ